MIILTYMNKYLAKAIITLKDEVKDVRALALEKMLKNTGMTDCTNFKTGRFYSFYVFAKDPKQANEKAHRICAEALCNPVVEKFEMSLVEIAAEHIK